MPAVTPYFATCRPPWREEDDGATRGTNFDAAPDTTSRNSRKACRCRRSRMAFIRSAAPIEHLIMAAIVLSVIPVIVAFLLTQRQFIAGIAVGAVKE